MKEHLQTEEVDLPPVTYLFVPGNRPERFAKALASGADRVIIDLEDAVAPADKPEAREAVRQWWTGAEPAHQAAVLVRVNDITTPWHAQDLSMLRSLQIPHVMLPKCEAAAQIALVLAGLAKGATLLVLIETARGIVALHDIAACPGVARLAFGSLDYMVDLDLPADSPALEIAAVQIAIASRAAGLPSPVAGVTAAVNSAEVASDASQARALGFGAKMCIHPAQVAPAHDAFMPTEAELAWAQRILAAWASSSGAALQVDGKMVDRPVMLRAMRLSKFFTARSC